MVIDDFTEVKGQQLDWLLTVRCQSYFIVTDTVICCRLHLKTRQMGVAGHFRTKFWSRRFLLQLYSNASNVCVTFTQRQTRMFQVTFFCKNDLFLFRALLAFSEHVITIGGDSGLRSSYSLHYRGEAKKTKIH